MLVLATSERFLPTGDTIKTILASESHWLQPMLVLPVQWWPTPASVWRVFGEGISKLRLDTRHFLYPESNVCLSGYRSDGPGLAMDMDLTLQETYLHIAPDSCRARGILRFDRSMHSITSWRMNPAVSIALSSFENGVEIFLKSNFIGQALFRVSRIPGNLLSSVSSGGSPSISSLISALDREFQRSRFDSIF